MRRGPQAGWSLKGAALGGMLFLHIPLLIIVLYAFSIEEKSFVFPIPGFTTKWFAVAFEREDVRRALGLSIRVAAMATALAQLLGTLAAAAVWHSRFFEREAI